MWYVYVLECADGTFYTGSTNNLEKRFLELAKESGIPSQEFDVAIWLYQSGEKEFYG